MGGHQISRPEPGGQRQLGVVHDGSGGDEVCLLQPAHSQVHALVCNSQALLLPQAGQTKPSGQRAANKYLTQAPSSEKRCWNSVKEGKSVICAANGYYVRFVFQYESTPFVTNIL
jgi:hypothetical protein